MRGSLNTSIRWYKKLYMYVINTYIQCMNVQLQYCMFDYADVVRPWQFYRPIPKCFFLIAMI